MSSLVFLFFFVTSRNYIGQNIITIIWLKPLYSISALLLFACIPASLTSSLPPGSASPSPTRWPSLRVKAVFPAPLARQNVAVAEPVRTDLKQSRNRGESTYTYGNLFAFDRVTLVSPVSSYYGGHECPCIDLILVIFSVFSPLSLYPFNCPPWWLRWGTSALS